MSVKKTEKTEAKDFPIEVFPQKLQSILKELHETKGIPIDFYAAGMLSVFSTVIGNTFHVQDLNSYHQIGSLYFSIVGNSSIGKSPALKWCLRPLYKLENEFQQDFDENDNIPKKDILLTDATIESINYLLSKNPKGLLLYKDELVGWLTSMTRYSNGSDVNYYLELWSGNFAKANRIGRTTNYIQSPFLGILGGTQPNLLYRFAKGDNLYNGLFQRILFVFPDNQKKAKRSKNRMNPNSNDIYNEWVKRVYELGGNDNVESNIKKIKLSLEADKIWGEWYDENTDEINAFEDKNHPKVSCLGKLEQYCLRFSLILEVIHQCHDDPAEVKEVSKVSMERAILLTEYFKNMLYKVFEKLENPLTSYPKKDIELLHALDDDFGVKKGTEAVQKVGLTSSEKMETIRRIFFRKVKQFIQDGLVEKVSSGNYIKLI